MGIDRVVALEDAAARAVCPQRDRLLHRVVVEERAHELNVRSLMSAALAGHEVFQRQHRKAIFSSYTLKAALEDYRTHLKKHGCGE